MNKRVSSAKPRVKSHAAQTTAPEFDAGTFGAEEALKAMVEYQVESLRFVARRTDCKLEYLRSLCHYIEWQDMAEVQRSWFKEWLADYGKERVRLAATGFALASGDFLPLPCSCTARQAARGAITPGSGSPDLARTLGIFGQASC